MTSRYQRELPTLPEVLRRYSLMGPDEFRALGGLTLTVGPESTAGYRHVAVEADDRNGSIERMYNVGHFLLDRMQETGAVRAVIMSKNPAAAIAMGRDLHVLDAIATDEVIRELGMVMPVEGMPTDQPAIALAA